ncbi:MAG: PKD domain-containing protein [Balneolaceae bacterium]
MTRYISILILIFALVACTDGPVDSSMDEPELDLQVQANSDITPAASSTGLFEVVEVDARLVGNPGGPALSTNILEAGVEYRITVDGNWSAWPSDWWDCTSPSPTKYLSPDVPNGTNAGIDAEYMYAKPGSCGMTPTGFKRLQFSLDAGTNYFYPTALDGAYNLDHVYEYEVTGVGQKAGFLIGDTNEDNHGIMKVTIEEIVTEVTVFTSDPSEVDSWGPILEDPLISNWEQEACTVNPAVGLDDPRWGIPHASYEVGPAAFESYTSWSGFDAPWINAWNNLQASAAPGAKYGKDTQNWTKFASTVSGDRDFVVQFLADNCSWIYLDGTLIGFQGTDWDKNPDVNGRYSLNLSGTHTLSFIVFDGGGQAGGKFRLETFKSFVDGGGDLDDTNPPIDPEPENNAPVADAGSDQTVTAIGPTTSITLNGSGSSDPDEDALSYSWILDGNEVATSTSATASVDLEKGSYTFTLTVSDGELSDSDEVSITVENANPVADAGPDQTLEATGPTTAVILDGSDSFDVDGDELTYAWSTDDTGVSPTVNLGVGVHILTLTVTDEEGATDSDEVTITITDTTAPELSFNQVVGNLWPPNHKMVLVATGISASDNVDGPINVDVTVSSSEAANGRGDGNTDSDYEIVTNPDGSIDVYVRSERSGKGKDGRTYTISMSTVDAAGNDSLDSFEVHVAQNQGRGR